MYGGNAYGWAYYGDSSQAGAITPPPPITAALVGVFSFLCEIRTRVATLTETRTRTANLAEHNTRTADFSE